MKKNLHTIIFGSLAYFFIAIGTLPGFFDWSNKIEPWVFNLPFSMFWLISTNVCIIIILFLWYFVDNATGVLDIDIKSHDKENEEE